MASSNLKFKTLSLKKHERPMTYATFNRDGDLLFTTSRDFETENVLLWNPRNGEIVGSFDGHQGVVHFVDVNFNSTMIVTAGVDKTVRFWSIEDFTEVAQLLHEGCILCCRLAPSERLLLTVQKKIYETPSRVFVFDVCDDLRLRMNGTKQSATPKRILYDDSFEGSLLSAVWTDLETNIVAACSDGLLRKFAVDESQNSEAAQNLSKAAEDGPIDAQNTPNNEKFDQDESDNAPIATAKIGNGSVIALVPQRHGQLLIASCSDYSVSVLLASDLSCVKTMRMDRPIYAAALNPRHPLILLGGGQESREVTTTSQQEGKLEVLYYNFATEELLGVTKNHFGPIYCMAMDSDGKTMATAGEDSFLRIHYFDDEFEEYCKKLDR